MSNSSAELKTATPTVLDQLRLLEQLRRDLTAIKQINTRHLELTRSLHADDFERESDIQIKVKELESTIKTDAALAYNDNPEIGKKPWPGVGIRVHTTNTPSYDPALALAWAKKHDLCLMLDRMAFDRLCETSTTRPGFVIFEEETQITATLATDLAKALNEGVS